jgi:hypothetical protein
MNEGCAAWLIYHNARQLFSASPAFHVPFGHLQVGSPKWRPWLEVAATSDDCRLASHAAKALLNLEALRWGVRICCLL